MEFMEKQSAIVKHCRARTIYGMIEKGGIFQSPNMMMGFARFDKNLGEMIPHVHPEEGMFVIDCANAFARFGASEDSMGGRTAIKPGMIMWAAEGEWHVFEFGEGGFLDIVFCLPVGEIVRPE